MRTNTTIGAAEDRSSLAGDGKELEIGFNGDTYVITNAAE